MDIGQRLKEAREEKGITLEYLQETTKIQKRYLAAIEEENFQVLPGKFYAKAFIKEYATAVGLDADELIASFEDSPPGEEVEEPTEYTRIKQSRADYQEPRNTASILPKVTVILLILAIIILAWVFYQKTASDEGGDKIKNDDNNEVIRTPSSDEDDDEVTEDDVTDEDESTKEDQDDEATKKDDEKEDKDSDEEPSFDVTEEGTGSRPESTVEVKNVKDDKLHIKLESDGESWVTVKTGNNNELYSETLTKDASPKEIDIDNEKEVNFVVGNATQLDITINGKEFKYPIDPDQKVFQKIKLIVK